MLNVGKYTVHGFYGFGMSRKKTAGKVDVDLFLFVLKYLTVFLWEKKEFIPASPLFISHAQGRMSLWFFAC